MIVQRSTPATVATKTSSRTAPPWGIAAGSLRLNPSFAKGLSCPDCDGGRMNRILLALTDGTPIDFVSCQTCQYAAWRLMDSTLELDGILSELASQQPPA